MEILKIGKQVTYNQGHEVFWSLVNLMAKSMWWAHAWFHASRIGGHESKQPSVIQRSVSLVENTQVDSNKDTQHFYLVYIRAHRKDNCLH